MDAKKEQNNPGKVFKEQDDLVVSNKKLPIAEEKLKSIRTSEITSIAPDDINWNNIYLGKKPGLHSVKPEADSQKKGMI